MDARHQLTARMSDAVRRLRARLSLRLLAWFLLFSLVPLLVTNAVGYRSSETIIGDQVKRYLAAIAEVQAEHVRDRIDHHLRLLQAITAGNDFLAAGAMRFAGRDAGEMGTVADRPTLERYLRDKIDELGAFDALYLAVPGRGVVAWAGRRDGVPEPLPAWGLTAEIGNHGVTGQPQFRLTVPVSGSHSSSVALLGASVSTLGSRDFLHIPEHLAGHVESFIVDERGRPLFVSHPHGDVNYSVPLSTPLLRLPSGSHARYRDRQGLDVIGSSSAIPGYPWRFIAEAPADEAFGELRQLRRLSLSLELVFIVLLVGAAWTVASGMVAPLHRLVDATRRVGRGDLEVRVAAREADELGELGRAFNEMTAALAGTTARVQELHQREIERASQLATVGELASGIAHEIKNPVVGVANGLDLVRRRVGEDPKLTPIMDEMARQLATIQRALGELLAFARPATPALAPVNGNSVVERAIRLVRPTAEQSGVGIDLRFDPSAGHFLADEEMLYQALVNLLMNALEASSHGGSLRVSTRVAGDEFEVRIADTGRGIPPEHLDQVFKPFFTTRHTGTGLGLPITREIIQRHGGRVTLASRVGEGTTVTVRLPMRAGEERASLPPEEA